MGRLFGTDGVRGIANTELTGLLAYQLGQAGAYAFIESAQQRPTILVGADTRISGDMLKAALMAGICSTGAIAMDIGVLPTPAVAYLTKKTGANAGIMISASHNPVEDNGIKFFDGNGFKLSSETEDRIEKIIEEIKPGDLPSGDAIGRMRSLDNASDMYRKFLLSTAETSFEGMRVVIDGANGAASYIAPELFRELGAKVTALSCEPDGLNINQSCGSTHPERLQEHVRQMGAHIGLAFDGDADRLIAVDENGQIFDGDHALAVCALHLKEKDALPNGRVVGTVMSNLGLKIALRENGLDLIAADVGDRNVLESMREGGHPLGGEQSGHIIFLEHSTTGDGMLAAVQLLSIMRLTGKPLSELRRVMQNYPQTLINVRVSESAKQSLGSDAEISAAIAELEKGYGEDGRVLIRASGTEPLIRVMIEGKDEQGIARDAQMLADLISQRLG